MTCTTAIKEQRAAANRHCCGGYGIAPADKAEALAAEAEELLRQIKDAATVLPAGSEIRSLLQEAAADAERAADSLAAARYSLTAADRRR